MKMANLTNNGFNNELARNLYETLKWQFAVTYCYKLPNNKLAISSKNQGSRLIVSCYLEDRGCPCGVMVKAMDCRIVISKSVFQSRYYVHFRANTIEKDMNPLILQAMG